MSGPPFRLNGSLRKAPISPVPHLTRGARAAPLSLSRDTHSFGDGVMKLSVAPSQGLFLDMSYFDLYCSRAAFTHDKLEWGENESEATKRWAEFKKEKIMDHILEEEVRECEGGEERGAKR